MATASRSHGQAGVAQIKPWPLCSGSWALPLCPGNVGQGSQMLKVAESKASRSTVGLCCCFWACGAPLWSQWPFHQVVSRRSLGYRSPWPLGSQVVPLLRDGGTMHPVVGIVSPLSLEQLSWWLRS